MIRGHSESELVNSINISKEIDYDACKVKKAYVLLVSSNEACSACTNIIPEIKRKVAEKMNFKNEEHKVQLLYFPIAEHQVGKLYIKLSANEMIYRKFSGSALNKSIIIFDAKAKVQGKHVFSLKNSFSYFSQKEWRDLDKIKKADAFCSKSFSQKSDEIKKKKTWSKKSQDIKDKQV